MSLVPLPYKPACDLRKSGVPTTHKGARWQTYIADDDDDDRIWEHNETTGRWFFVVGSDEP